MVAKTNLVIDQGSDFSQEFVVIDQLDNPVDFTGYDIAASIKKSYESNTSYAFTTIGFANGAIQISMPANVSINIEYGQYVWDLKAVSPAPIVTTKRLLEGMVQITPRVT